MATYKAEFLAHYYTTHRRPLTAYTFGMISRWASLAEFAPTLVNFGSQTPGLRTLAKFLAGMPAGRCIPAFAPDSFRTRFARRTPLHGPSAPAVVLWPDTFNDHFHPDTLTAAVEVLEASGFRVEMPRRRLCCGRPLYDYGLLDRARQHLVETMDALAGEIEQGTPIVVLEPSCAAVFHDELLNLFPEDPRAGRLSEQVFSLGSFLHAHKDRLPPMALRRRALVHGHCHQKALGRMDADTGLLTRLGLVIETPDGGCCGMAGSFGFERDHYDVSLAVGERVLLPAVRQAARDALIVADGFSGREQIAQQTDRRALHLADVLRMALRQAPHGPAGDYPEAAALERYEHEVALSGRTAALLLGGAAAATVAFIVSNWRTIASDR